MEAVSRTHRKQLGGANAVIIADVFVDPATEFPILYLADTVTIPTRSHLHVLDLERPEQSPRDVVLAAMRLLANRLIRAGSYLVLGPRLQHWLTADELHKHVGHLVQAVIAFDRLQRFDRPSDSAFDVADNFEEMSRWAKGVCSAACRLVDLPDDTDDDHRELGERGRRLERLECLLAVANAVSGQITGRGEQPLVMWSCAGVYRAF